MIVDNEFKGLIPPLSKEEYTGLEQSIITEGCRESIITWNDIVIDGHNRYEICTKNNIPYKTLPKVFNSKHEVINWIIENQLGRRNLTPEQKLYLIGKKYKEEKKQVGAQEGNKNAQKQREQNVPFEDTADRIADQCKVSHMTVKRAEKFAEAVDKIAETAGQEVKQKILSREIDLNQKEVIALTEKPKEVQKAIIENLDKGIASSYRDANRLLIKENVKNTEVIEGKYRVFYADPPWQYGNKGLDEYGHAERHYPTMSIQELCDMPIRDISEDNAVLFLWVTSPFLEDSFKVINAWGFKYKTSFVWDKVKHNMGHYNSVRHELLLVCTRGSCTPDESKLFDSVQAHERTDKHSEKPEIFRDIINTLYKHGNKIELFARKKTEGWVVYGNQV